ARSSWWPAGVNSQPLGVTPVPLLSGPATSRANARAPPTLAVPSSIAPAATSAMRAARLLIPLPPLASSVPPGWGTPRLRPYSRAGQDGIQSGLRDPPVGPHVPLRRTGGGRGGAATVAPRPHGLAMPPLAPPRLASRQLAAAGRQQAW